MKTDRYGASTLVREPEVKRDMSPEARATRLNLHGPAREFAITLMHEFPVLSDYQVDRCVRGWLEGQLKDRAARFGV